MPYSIEHIQKMSTKNLLALYKAERGRLGRLAERCDCCGSTVWENYPNSSSSIKAKKEYEEYEKYVVSIKDILSTREHAERKVEPHVNKKTKDPDLTWRKSYVTKKVPKRKR